MTQQFSPDKVNFIDLSLINNNNHTLLQEMERSHLEP